MKHYTFLIWLNVQTRPNCWTYKAESIATALAMLLLANGIKDAALSGAERKP